MIPATLPEGDHDRVAALHALRVLDTPPDPRFDRITALTRRLLDVPVAVIGFVDAGREWFRSASGTLLQQVPRSWSVAAHAILEEDALVVADTHTDARFRENPLVVGEPNARMLLAYPIRAMRGDRIGALWVCSPVARKPHGSDIDALEHLAATVEHELGVIQPAVIDRVTGLANRRGFVALARKVLEAADRRRQPATLLFLDLNGFRAVNAAGLEAGNEVLRQAAQLLQDTFRESDVVARVGGDEFCVLLMGTTTQTAEAATARLQHAIATRTSYGELHPAISFSLGLSRYRHGEHEVSDLIAEAAEGMERQREDWRAQTA